MLFLVLLPASALIALWLSLMSMVSREDWITATYNKVFDNRVMIEKLRLKDKERAKKLSCYHGFSSVVIHFLLRGNNDKKIKKLERLNRQLQSGNLKKTSIWPMPGYVLSRKFDAIGKGSTHKVLTTKCSELYGRKHAVNRANHMMAKLLSYPIIGISGTLLLSAMLIGIGNSSTGLTIMCIGPMLIIVLAYAMYDNLCESVNKRRASINKQFPNVCSKLALLMTSGMIMDRAWKETAYSQESELYQEMRKTSQELDNLVSPETAYSGFISRCNTKEASKLASAIMQNLSKGNTEIARLLKEIAKEAWLERRHTARRDAEKANSKLMIPTMLLFIAILIMLLVPIAMNFTDI